MRSPRYRGPDARSSPPRDLRLAHRLSACSTRRPGVAVGGAVAACCLRVKGLLQGRDAAHTTRSHGQQDGARHGSRGQAEAEAWPGSRCSVFLVCDYICSSAARSRSSAAWSRASARWFALVGGPLPRVGSGLGVLKAAARWASPVWAVCNAASACPARASAARTLASSTARPAIRSRWASWTTSWARSATLREVV
jgi:hypothetical protein